ncbi:MAG: hypothetical protein ACC742_10035 [Thermoanaerobaculales bacterium]
MVDRVAALLDLLDIPTEERGKEPAACGRILSLHVRHRGNPEPELRIPIDVFPSSRETGYDVRLEV